jgi:uncharacterized protein YcbX
MPLHISQLFIYPIKSVGGISVHSSPVTSTGLLHDRRWMLVDQRGRFISQRENSTLALLRIQVRSSALVVFHKDHPTHSLEIPFFDPAELHSLPRAEVIIWDDICNAMVYPQRFTDWFTRLLETPCQLVYMDDTVRREVDKKYAFRHEITSFSDGFPLLMIGQSSLDDLNTRLPYPIPINRFRPNLVFEGGYPFQEDEMSVFEVNGLEYKAVKPCARCIIPTIDQETGIQYEEPTKTLASYRLKDKKILFGQNVLVSSIGTISVGDEIHLK